jgi:hypothetical protein
VDPPLVVSGIRTRGLELFTAQLSYSPGVISGVVREGLITHRHISATATACFGHDDCSRPRAVTYLCQSRLGADPLSPWLGEPRLLGRMLDERPLPLPETGPFADVVHRLCSSFTPLLPLVAASLSLRAVAHLSLPAGYLAAGLASGDHYELVILVVLSGTNLCIVGGARSPASFRQTVSVRAGELVFIWGGRRRDGRRLLTCHSNTSLLAFMYDRGVSSCPPPFCEVAGPDADDPSLTFPPPIKPSADWPHSAAVTADTPPTIIANGKRRRVSAPSASTAAATQSLLGPDRITAFTLWSATADPVASN